MTGSIKRMAIMILNYVGLGLLFLAILYTGYQGNVYLRGSRSMGKLLLSLSPSKGQKRFLSGIGIAFALLLAVVTNNYINAGITLNASYSMLIAAVILSAGRLLSTVVEFRENGILGHGTEISYKSIRTYKVDKRSRRAMVDFPTDGWQGLHFSFFKG